MPDNITPQQAGFAMPAEWYPHAGCWMAWPCHAMTWQTIGLTRAREAYAKVANAIQSFEPVTLLVNPGDEDLAVRLCDPDIRRISLPLDDSWTRDTGPSFLLNAQQQLAGVDWIHNAWGGNYTPCTQDNAIASAILSITNARTFTAPLVMEGGAFHVDGEGTLLTTKACLLNPNRNPLLSQAEISAYLQAYLGIEKIIWLDQGLAEDETDGHIDELACFIAPGHVLCLTSQDRQDVNYTRLQDNIALLRSSRDAKGRALTVTTIEQPAAVYHHHKRLTLSYINYYIANGGIVIPAFGQEYHDNAARELFESLYPDRKVIQIQALDIVTGGGGIHCITQQQPLSNAS